MLTASLETPEPVEADLSVPDNIDDAMAWLEQLAARQGAPLDELPTVTGEVGDLKTPIGLPPNKRLARQKPNCLRLRLKLMTACEQR